MKKAALFLALMVSAAASAADVEHHRKFLLEGIYDATLPNGDAYAIVREGIKSGNSEVVYLTVAALGVVAAHQYAANSGYELQTGRGKQPQWDFSEVPGLKEFLIGHWREQHARSGYHAFGQERLEGIDPVTFLEQPPPSYAWKMVPSILCRFYPQDSEVHDLVWEIYETEATPRRTQTLAWLNDCRFKTHEADAYRMSVLVESQDEEDVFAEVGLAVRGLALSRRAEALPLMIDAWLKHPIAGPEIVAAISSYPDDQLAPHTEQLGQLVGDYPSNLASEATLRALHRLQRLAGIEERSEAR